MAWISEMRLRQSSDRPSLSTWVHGGRPGKNWNPVFVDFCCAGVGKIDFDALTQIIILRNHRDAPRTPDISITYRGRGRAGPKVLTGHHGRMPVVSIWNKYSRYLVNGPALLVISNVATRGGRARYFNVCNCLFFGGPLFKYTAYDSSTRFSNLFGVLFFVLKVVRKSSVFLALSLSLSLVTPAGNCGTNRCSSDLSNIWILWAVIW